MRKKRFILPGILISVVVTACAGIKNPDQSKSEEISAHDPYRLQETLSLTSDDSDVKLMEKINKYKIPEQSFDISLNDWGEVTFVTCMPDTTENPIEDISLYLIKNEKVLYHFPDIEENNTSMAGICDGVSFVFFKDVNNDNRTDVVIGAWYESGAGPQGMIPRTQIQIYTDNKTEFVYEKELCDKIKIELPEETTAAQVKELIFQ